MGWVVYNSSVYSGSIKDGGKWVTVRPGCRMVVAEKPQRHTINVKVAEELKKGSKPVFPKGGNKHSTPPSVPPIGVGSEGNK